MPERTIDVPEWTHLCTENARDIILNQTAEMATGYNEWVQKVTPEYPNLSSLGTTIGIDFEREKNEGFSVGQSVCGIVDAATVLEELHEDRHQTDTGQWMGATRTNRNGASLVDLNATVIAMATSSLEMYVGHLMADLHEHIWSKLEDRFDEDESLQITDEMLEEIIAEW